jgi:hypothetical protein
MSKDLFERFQSIVSWLCFVGLEREKERGRDGVLIATSRACQ